jgi:hypothetical protein
MKLEAITEDQLDPVASGGLIPITEADLDPQAQFTPTETFGLQSTDLFGAGDAIGAVVNSILRGGKYDEWRKKFAAARKLAAEQNPIASTAGKVTSFASELAVGGAAGKVVQGLGKASGVAAKLAPWAEANPIIAKTLSGAASGAGFGAASGAGQALSADGDVLAGAAGGAVPGAVAGGVIGSAAGVISKLFRGAGERADKALMRTVGEVDDVARKDVLETLRADKSLQKAVAKGAEETTPFVTKKIADITAKLEPLLAKSESPTIGGIWKAFDQEISGLAKSPLKERVIDDLASVRKSVLKSWAPDFVAALESAEAKQSSAVRDSIVKQLGAQKVPAKEVSDVISQLVEEGTRGKVSQNVFKKLRDEAFESAKSQESKSVVNEVRRLEKEKTALENIMSAVKSKRGEGDGGLHRIISLFTHHGPVGAGLALAAGHPIPAAILAAPAVGRIGNATLAMLQREAAAGNQRAIRIIQAAQAAQTVGTAGAGMAGSATTTTLANEGAQ